MVYNGFLCKIHLVAKVPYTTATVGEKRRTIRGKGGVRVGSLSAMGVSAIGVVTGCLLSGMVAVANVRHFATTLISSYLGS